MSDESEARAALFHAIGSLATQLANADDDPAVSSASLYQLAVSYELLTRSREDVPLTPDDAGKQRVKEVVKEGKDVPKDKESKYESKEVKDSDLLGKDLKEMDGEVGGPPQAAGGATRPEDSRGSARTFIRPGERPPVGRLPRP